MFVIREFLHYPVTMDWAWWYEAMLCTVYFNFLSNRVGNIFTSFVHLWSLTIVLLCVILNQKESRAILPLRWAWEQVFQVWEQSLWAHQFLYTASQIGPSLLRWILWTFLWHSHRHLHLIPRRQNCVIFKPASI